MIVLCKYQPTEVVDLPSFSEFSDSEPPEFTDSEPRLTVGDVFPMLHLSSFPDGTEETAPPIDGPATPVLK
jgi:hypothetical protein